MAVIMANDTLGVTTASPYNLSCHEQIFVEVDLFFPDARHVGLPDAQLIPLLQSHHISRLQKPVKILHLDVDIYIYIYDYICIM